MNNKVWISKAPSLDSLNTRTSIETSILTSTKYHDNSLNPCNNNNRRKAILPTPNRPKEKNKIFRMNTEDKINGPEQKVTVKVDQGQPLNSIDLFVDNDANDNSLPVINSNMSTDKNTDFVVGSDNVIESSSTSSRPCNDTKIVNPEIKVENYKEQNKLKPILKNNDVTNEIDNQSTNEEDADNDSFDSFILQNFVSFSGKQNVIQWLDRTENKFKQFSIGRHLRFQAISLLVEGDAKRKYIKVRKNIESFDDFYEFLLSEFEYTRTTSGGSQSHSNIKQISNDLSKLQLSTSANESKGLSINDSNISNLTRTSPLLSSTAFVNFGATNSVDVQPGITSTILSDTVSNSVLDQTSNELRKAIVGNLIKNPKTFKGGKDDVKKWLEEIEHLLDIAHIPNSSRLDLISYSLRGDALEWYKNNRSSITSWEVFILELKKAFTSSFHEELAFKKLESYSQGENQSIRNFYNEILKLCKEADSTMSEATKLKNLLNKTKPSIQFEVRKKKPISITEFLEYAKDAEELMQLSDITTENNNDKKSSQVILQQKATISSESKPQISNNSAFSNNFNNHSFNNPRKFNNNFSDFNNRHNNNNNFPTFSSFKRSQNTHRFNENTSRPHQERYNNNTKFYQHQNNNSNNRFFRPRTANTINFAHTSPDTQPLPETISSIACDRCNQLGHEASMCASF